MPKTEDPLHHHLTETRLSSYDLPEEVRRGIEAAGFVHATPIQARTLPITLAGRDVAGQAQTGTGKTAAFLITIFTRLLRSTPKERRGPRALVIAPTRELVVQIKNDAEVLGSHTGLTTLAVYGGIDYARQRDALRRKPDVLVGTPGRLLDYEQQKATTFRDVELLVIDEADRMFDMGFIRDLRRILRRCPPYDARQTFLFSATLSPGSWSSRTSTRTTRRRSTSSRTGWARTGSPKCSTTSRRTRSCRSCSGSSRRRGSRILIFVNRRTTAADLVRTLTANGYPARALAGNVPQDRRLKILTDFKEGRLAVLVATDVASRGLHIDGVSHVVNYDLPQDAEDYVHRIGRTGRAGAVGTAVSIACDDYVFSLDAIQKLIGRGIPVLWAPEEIVEKGRLIAEAKPHRRAPARKPARPSAPSSVTYGREKRKSRRR